MDIISALLGLLLSFTVLITVALFTLSWLTTWPMRTRNELLRKMRSYEPSGVESDEFPSLLHTVETTPAHTAPTLYLSVIIPAMNEKQRLPIMLDECLPYLKERQINDNNFTYEIIIVDDGSTDRTADVGHDYGKQYPDMIKVLRLSQNQGKGGAVRCGVLRARGSLILFVDADGATRFADFGRLEDALLRSSVASNARLENIANFDWTFPSVAVGSRAHMETESIATRSFMRTLLMFGFHVMVYLFAVQSVRDTQCGFKLFSRGAAAKLFPLLHIERWAFDVELLFLAERLRIPVREVAVTWHEVEGSKIVPFWSWLQMGRDLLLIWFRYAVGIWRCDRL